MNIIKTLPFIFSLLILSACLGETGSQGRSSSEHNHAAMQSSETQAIKSVSRTQEATSYTCPMHPHYISTDPDGTCPICGMDLVPVAKTSSQDSGIAVSPEMIQTMGIRTTPVVKFSFSPSLRSYGTVEPNTRLESMSASRLEGWISGLTVRAEGDVVRRGQRLYSIYAPDLIAAQKDYLASIRIGNDKRIASVHQRLKSKGLQDTLVDQLRISGELIEYIPVYSESSGIVTELMVRDGDYLKPGDPIARLQRYDEVWVIASVPESDLPKVFDGQSVSLSFDSLPREKLIGTVDYIYPTIESTTRTARIRITLSNENGKLKPGAYADIRFDTRATNATSQTLAVPSQAILRDSRGAHVIMALGEGRFEPRAVRIGRRANGRTEILAGLTLADEIVSSGQFMLDSEASLRSGFARSGTTFPIFDETTPLSELPINATTLAQIDHLVDTALYFHEALIDGYQIDPYFLDPTLTLITDLKTRFEGSKLSPILGDARLAIESAKTHRSGESLMRSLSDLMTALYPWLMRGAPSHHDAQGVLLYSDRETGRLWLQKGGQPANPYGNDEARHMDWPNPMFNSAANMRDAP